VGVEMIKSVQASIVLPSQNNENQQKSSAAAQSQFAQKCNKKKSTSISSFGLVFRLHKLSVAHLIFIISLTSKAALLRGFALANSLGFGPLSGDS